MSREKSGNWGRWWLKNNPKWSWYHHIWSKSSTVKDTKYVGKKGGKTNLSMFLSVCQINAFVIFATGILNSIHQIDQKKILGGSYLKVGIFVHASKCKQYWKCTKSRRRGKSYATRNNHCNSTGKKWRKCNFSRKLFLWGTQKLNVREGVHVKVLLAAVFYYIGNAFTQWREQYIWWQCQMDGYEEVDNKLCAQAKGEQRQSWQTPITRQKQL